MAPGEPISGGEEVSRHPRLVQWSRGWRFVVLMAVIGAAMASSWLLWRALGIFEWSFGPVKLSVLIPAADTSAWVVLWFLLPRILRRW